MKTLKQVFGYAKQLQESDGCAFVELLGVITTWLMMLIVLFGNILGVQWPLDILVMLTLSALTPAILLLLVTLIKLAAKKIP